VVTFGALQRRLELADEQVEDEALVFGGVPSPGRARSLSRAESMNKTNKVTDNDRVTRGQSRSFAIA